MDARRRVAGKIADAFIAPLRGLRGLDERYFEEMVEEVFLPRHWYLKHEPALLRLLGDVEDDDTRHTLTTIVTSLGSSKMRPDPRAGYHYIEAQLLLGLEVVNAYGRGQALDAKSQAEVDDLSHRRASTGEQ